ncbi:MAG: NADPH-dependent glutamate synthase [Eubacteriales bacterium]
MANMSLKKNIMPEQPPDVRNKNFDEVALGYSEQQAVDEALRCLNCKHKPCVSGCPVEVDIPGFIQKVAKGDFEGGYEVITRTNSLPAVCGRVCPQEKQCEEKCVRAIKGESVGIGRLERFCADFHRESGKADTCDRNESNGIKVAVVGSGPAGLTCAGELARMGYSVTLFEALHSPGGVLVYGIPEFRLPKDIVGYEINNIRDMGVDIQTGMVIGKVLSVDELFEDGYEAVFVGSGAGLPGFLGIEGENLIGVYSANEYLTRVNLMKAYEEESDTPIMRGKNVAVIGGGNVAMDAARSAKRLGADKVSIIYRRSRDEMPARAEEIHHCEEEGVVLELLTFPVKINGSKDKFVESITCGRMELSEPDASGRPKPVPVEGSEFDIECDTVILAIGNSPNPLIRMTTPGLETNKRGCIVTAEDGVTTSREGVFAGGDTVTGAATVILAMGAGRKAAQSMDEYIRNKKK